MKIYDSFRHDDDFYGGQRRQETDLGWVYEEEDLRMLIPDFSGAGGKSLWDAARDIVASREQGKFD